MEEKHERVLQDLRTFLTSGGGGNDEETKQEEKQQHHRSLFDKSITAVPVAAIKALLCVVERSKAETMMGLQEELREAANLMTTTSSDNNNNDSSEAIKRPILHYHSNIALQSGCELFMTYITRTFLELDDFDACKKIVLERGTKFHHLTTMARDCITNHGNDFISNNTTILTHGWSRTVASILYEASKTKHFDVIILEGRPDASGVKAAYSYQKEANIPVTVILDSAMGYIMERVDMVLVGAEGVLENGGIVNKIGTLSLAACANAFGKPFYVAAESYKFARLYPLHQTDLLSLSNNTMNETLSFVDTTTTTTKANDVNKVGEGKDYMKKMELDDSMNVLNPSVDFTPAKFITLLFTDLGVLTPSAVSDELIRLYQ